MSYHCLLFDADDTLFDFQAAEEKSLNETFAILKLPQKAKEDYRKISHQLWAQLEQKTITLNDLKQTRFKKLLEIYPTDVKDDPEALYEAHLASHADLLPGALAMIKRLALSYRLFIISNGMPNIQHPRLQKSGLEKYFEKIFISEELGAQKPSKEFFDKVFENANFTKAECLVIGDSLTSDIAGGKNYGLDTCLINFRHLKTDLPTYSVKNYDELIKLLERMQ